MDKMKDERPTLTWASQYTDETTPMRAPFLVCKGFVDAGWNVDIITMASPHNENIDCLWNSVPIRKVIGISERVKKLKLGTALFKRGNNHMV